MSLKDKTTFIAAIELAAQAYQEAIGDDTLTGVALPLSNPKHPLRKLKRLTNLDDSGTFTEDAVYIAGAYAGEFPSKGSQDLDKVVNAPTTAPLTSEVERTWNEDGFSVIAGDIPDGAFTFGEGDPTDGPYTGYGLASLKGDTTDQASIIEGWAVGIWRMVEKDNQSNFLDVDVTSISELPTGNAQKTYGIIKTGANLVWSISTPAVGAVILINAV